MDDDAQDARELGALDHRRCRVRTDVRLQASARHGGPVRRLPCSRRARAALMVAELSREAHRRTGGGVKRVVLIGSESTGKTTLARRLAEHYGVEWIPEFVREYTVAKNGALDFSDHGAIARGQMALEDEHITRATSRHARLLIQDTD